MSVTHFPVTGPILLLDPTVQESVLAHRRECGGDRYDEVWEGTYVMSPLPNLEHQRIVLRLAVILDQVVQSLGKGEVFPGANVTDRMDCWEENFRCPDVVVVLDAMRVTSQESAIVGGPEFLVEVASPGDRWRDKLPFYAKIGVRELLIIDRETKDLELFRAGDSALLSVGKSDQSTPTELNSQVLPVKFRWIDKSGARIEVHRNDGQSGSWLI